MQESHLNTIIAKSSLRCGFDIRIIAAVALAFLPGIFIATLFSTSFWNFQPENNGPVVSKWVSLYWVLTVILTLGVLAAWRYFSTKNMESIKLFLDRDLNDLPKVSSSETDRELLQAG